MTEQSQWLHLHADRDDEAGGLHDMERFSTADIPERDRLAVLNEVVARHEHEVSVDGGPSMRIAAGDLMPLKIFKTFATSASLLAALFLLAGCGHGLINRLI